MDQVGSEADARLAALGRDIRRCTTTVQPLDPEMLRLLGEIDRAEARIAQPPVVRAR